MLDYLIIGFGLAGLSFTETALQKGKSCFVIDSEKNYSSRVAPGLYNPVILKRFSVAWKADEQLDHIDHFYQNLENQFAKRYYFPLPIYRKLFSVEEQNNWFVAADHPILSSFLSPQLITHKINHIDAPYDFGEVLHSGYLDVNQLLNDYVEELKNKSIYRQEVFDYFYLEQGAEGIEYKGLKAKQIIFCEGYGAVNNPYFNYLPLDGAKGEVLLIHAPELDLEVILKTGIFILPVGNHYYKVGSTYHFEDKTVLPTESAKQELLEKLKEVISCPFQLIEHNAGIRPTTRDRRPFVGVHPKYEHLYILNGLGTRGVMIGPYVAKHLFDFIENQTELPLEMDIKRLKKYTYPLQNE